MVRALSNRQKEIMKFIEEYIVKHNYPPTIRDICEGCAISSTSVVDYNLNRLQELHYISRDSKVSRGITVVRPIAALQSKMAEHAEGERRRARIIRPDWEARNQEERLRIPIWGSIAAGEPISVPSGADGMYPAEDGDYVELAHDMLRPPPGRRLFAMRVKGHSMIDALINDGDIVIFAEQEVCDKGDMVAAWLKEEQQTTLKRFYPEGPRIRLQPENTQMAPIYCDASNLEIKGKVMMVIRRC